MLPFLVSMLPFLVSLIDKIEINDALRRYRNTQDNTQDVVSCLRE